MVNSRDLINQRQAELLARIAGGDTLSSPEDADYRRSAYALRGRGLVTTSNRGGVFTAAITERGRFYLEHDRHPGKADITPTPTATRLSGDYHADVSASEDEHLLIDLLVAAPDKTVWIKDPDEDIRAAYRRTVHSALQHDLVPDGFVLRLTGRTSGDLVIRLLDAERPDETDWNRVRLHQTKATPQQQDLEQLLDENPAALNVSDAQRPRARQILLQLAKEAQRHGHQVKLAQRGQHAKLGYLIGTVQRSLDLREEYDQPSLPSATARLQHYAPRAHQVQGTPSGRLRLEIGRAPSSAPDTWVEKGRTTLKAKIREIVARVQAGVEDDERARQDQARRQQEWKAAEELRQAAEKIVWQDAMDHARPKAIADLRHATLIAALNAWRDARDMREICAILNTAANNATDAGQTKLAENLAAWRDDGLTLADTVDPTIEPASLGTLTHDLDPTPDDLRPHLDGWNPDGPRRDTYNNQRDPKPSRPWPAEWSRLRK